MFLLIVVLPIQAGKINWPAVRGFVASAQDRGVQPTASFGQQEVNGVRMGCYFEPDVDKLLRERGGATVNVCQESNRNDSLILYADPLKSGWGLSYYQSVSLRLDPVTEQANVRVSSRRLDNDGSDNRINYYGTVGADGTVDPQISEYNVSWQGFVDKETKKRLAVERGLVLPPDSRPATGPEIHDIRPTLLGRAEVFARVLRDQNLLAS